MTSSARGQTRPSPQRYAPDPLGRRAPDMSFAVHAFITVMTEFEEPACRDMFTLRSRHTIPLDPK
ncbi:hypothetical protein C8Q73DRAFT_703560 [Cubamyces lactineus]|nr:hypothetical protein C8Q73DRAFT_703560 [Cubamyces lactineus]